MKRIILSLIVTMMIAVGASAQYTYLTNHAIGVGNPGGLNTLSDASITGFTALTSGGEAANYWSDTVGIGFPFNFYGVPVTHFKVSGNGVITFDTSATMIPSDTNTNLPAANSNIPNNSILGFWESFTGGAPLGGNDRIYTRTFGTSPNRQLWIRYYSFEYGVNAAGTGTGSSFNYWDIVLEETTDKIYVMDNHYFFTASALSMTVGVQKDATTAVQMGDSTITSTTPTQSGNTDNSYYEFTPLLLVNNNAGITSIDEPFAPLSGGLQPVKVTLKNHGLNALTSAVVQWTVNGVMQTPFNWLGNLASQASDPAITIGQYNVGPGNLDIVAWTVAPNGMADANPANDTSSVSLCTPLSGTFTVGGTNPDYADISAAIDAIANCGLNGPIVFDVAAGTYQGGIEITEIIGVSALNNITFNGAGIGNTIITYDRSGTLAATLNFDGADYFTFRNMTIENTATTAAFATQAWGIHFTNAANYNTFDSCRIKMDLTTTSSYILPVVASGTGTSSSALGDNANYLVIKNSEIVGGGYGMRIIGPTGTTSYNSYNQILNNTFTEQYSYGIYADEQDSLTIIGNTVNGFRATFGYGIYMFDQMHPNVQNNIILDAKNYGIYISDANFDMPPVARGKVINNIVKNIGTSTFNYGIFADDWEDMDVFHNTVYSVGAPAFYCNDLTNTVVKNNIFYSKDYYALRSLDATSSFTLDYNLYYSDGQFLAQEFNINLADLAAWKLGTPSSNQNSLEGDPNFIDVPNGDLHVTIGPALVAGDNTVGVMTDIDGDARPLSPTTTVDMGADEILVQLLDAGIANFDSPVAPVTPGLNPIEVTLKNNGVTPLTAVTINWTADGIPQTPFSWTGNLLIGEEANNVAIGNYNIANGFYNFEIWTEAPNGGTDNDSANDTLYYTTCTPLTGTYTIGSSATAEFSTIADAVTSVAGCGIGGPVIFNIEPGVYAESIRLTEVPGASATNTITFNGMDRDSVLLTYDGSGEQKATVLFHEGDHYVLENITIENTASTNAWGVRLNRNANYNTIQDSRVTVPVVTASTAASCIIASNSATSFSSQGQNAHNTLIKDNELIGGYGSVIFYGQTGTGNLNRDNTVDGNEMIDNYFYGAYFYAQENPTGINNTIREFGATGGYGMYHSQGRGSVFEGNFIADAGTYGVYLTGIHTSTFYPSQKDASIVNNMITAVGTGRGIYIGSGKRINIYHNTVSTENGLGLYIGFTEDSIDIRNNILTTTGAEAIEFSNSAGPKAIDIIDNNVYLRRDGGDFAEIGNDFYSDLLTWKNDDAARNTASVVGDPLFLDPANGDLHAVGGVANDAGDNSVGVLVDIDGDLRPATGSVNVDIGADEYTPLLDDLELVEVYVKQNSCNTATDSIWAVVRSIGLNQVTSFTTTTNVTGAISLTLNSTALTNLGLGLSDTILLGTFNSSAGGWFYIDASIALANDQNIGNDSSSMISIQRMSAPIGTVTDVACLGDSTGMIALDFTSSGAITNYVSAFDNQAIPAPNTTATFNINVAPGALTNVGISFEAFGDIDGFTEYVDIIGENGTSIGIVGGYGSSTFQCVDLTGVLPISDADYAAWSADGVITLTAQSTTDVNPTLCGGDYLNLAVSGDGAPDLLWNTGDTTDIIGALGAGNYTVTATDVLGCVQSAAFTITEPTASTPTITGVTADSVSCFGLANGSVTATVTGGTGQLTYDWSNGGTTASLTGLAPGNYSVVVSDANGCTDSTGIMNGAIITQPDSLQGSVSYTIFSCDSVNISSTLMGGTTPYSYSWSGGATGSSISVGSGNYDLTVTDANGCTETVSVTTVLPAALVVTATETAADTSGAGKGAATATATDGAAPYTYLWSNGATTETISGVIFGTYTVTVTDANGCTETGSVNINFPTNTENLTVIGAIDMFPNPTNGLVTFNIAMKSNDDLSITIFNAIGQEMTTIRKDNVDQVTQRFDTSVLASGIYLVRFTAGDDVVTKRLIVRK